MRFHGNAALAVVRLECSLRRAGRVFQVDRRPPVLHLPVSRLPAGLERLVKDTDFPPRGRHRLATHRGLRSSTTTRGHQLGNFRQMASLGRQASGNQHMVVLLRRTWRPRRRRRGVVVPRHGLRDVRATTAAPVVQEAEALADPAEFAAELEHVLLGGFGVAAESEVVEELELALEKEEAFAFAPVVEAEGGEREGAEGEEEGDVDCEA